MCGSINATVLVLGNAQNKLSKNQIHIHTYGKRNHSPPKKKNGLPLTLYIHSMQYPLK